MALRKGGEGGVGAQGRLGVAGAGPHDQGRAVGAQGEEKVVVGESQRARRPAHTTRAGFNATAAGRLRAVPRRIQEQRPARLRTLPPCRADE